MTTITVTTYSESLARARAIIAEVNQRADKRQVGDHVRYPRLEGDRYVDATGIIESIRCITPSLPYADRTFEFVIACDRIIRSHDLLHVAPNYRGIVPLG